MQTIKGRFRKFLWDCIEDIFRENAFAVAFDIVSGSRKRTKISIAINDMVQSGIDRGDIMLPQCECYLHATKGPNTTKKKGSIKKKTAI